MKNAQPNTQIKITDDNQPTSLLSHLWTSLVTTLVLTLICCAAYPLAVYAIAQAAFPHQANGSLVKKDGAFATRDQDAVGSSLLGQNFTSPAYFHPRPSAAGTGYDASASGGSNLGPLSDKLINGLPGTALPPATQPAAPAYDGIRLRTIHYALENNLPFKLHHAIYATHPDGAITLDATDEVPIKAFLDSDGNPQDQALVEAFPHPTTPDEYARTVLIADNFAQPIPADAVTASASGLDPHVSPANAEIQKRRVAAARNVTVEQIETLIQQNVDQPSLALFGEPGVNVLMLNLAIDKKYPLPPSQSPAK